MTSKRGRVIRKKRPAPLIEGQLSAPVECHCPYCETTFDPDDLAGDYLDRRCPRCGERITPGSFDSVAREASDERREMSISSTSLEQQLDRFRQSSIVHLLLRVPLLSKLIKQKMKKLETKCEASKESIDRLKKRSRILAWDRYYTSEFYLRTHTPLKRGGRHAYFLHAHYDSSGNWHMDRHPSENAGLVAEYSVAQRLFDRVADPSSVLYKAQVLPNLFVPKYNANEHSSFWTQIDCVLLTKQGAFVLEVKRRAAYLVIVDDFRTIYSTRNNELIASYLQLEDEQAGDELLKQSFSRKESEALSQNSYHTECFFDVCREYPYERIFEQTVYVSPRSFHSRYDHFADNVNVSWASDEVAPFIEVIERACEQHDAVLTQSEIDTLGERMLGEYGDLNQKREAIHRSRLERRN